MPGLTPDRSSPITGDELLRETDVCQILKIGRTKYWELVWSGVLPSVRIGRAVRVSRSALEEFIRQESVPTTLERR